MQFAHHTDHAPRLIATGVGKLRNDLLELGEDRGSLAERHGDTELVSTMLQRRPGDLYTSVQAIFSQALGIGPFIGFLI